MTDTKLDRLDEFMKATFLLNEDELKALDKQITMTQEMFDHLCERLIEIGTDRLVLELMLDYPDLLLKSAERIEKELGITEKDIVPLTQEEAEAGLKDIMKRIEELNNE